MQQTSSQHSHPHSHDHALATAVAPELPTFVSQQYAGYDADAHDVWRILYERRMTTLHDTGSAVFLDGIERIGLSPSRVPDLTDVNRRLGQRTGWAGVAVEGFIPAGGGRSPSRDSYRRRSSFAASAAAGFPRRSACGHAHISIICRSRTSFTTS